MQGKLACSEEGGTGAHTAFLRDKISMSTWVPDPADSRAGRVGSGPENWRQLHGALVLSALSGVLWSVNT